MTYGILNIDGTTTSWGDTSAGLYGFKNRIINGAMMIDQRNSGASTSPTGGAYTIDRWYYDPSGAFSWFSFQLNGGGVTPPAGFASYLGMTSLGANTPSSSTFCTVRQTIEGFNTSDLNWGTTNAQSVTLSFKVYSSLTGTFGGVIRNGASTYSYAFTYTISSANTWTTCTITIPGPAVGSWSANTNSGSVVVVFSLGVGSNYLISPGTWTSGWYHGATGTTNYSATSGATFYITGVQLEKGTTATSFDYRPYGTELQLCQRYYYQWSTAGGDGYTAVGNGTAVNTTYGDFVIQYPVTMRIAPTTTFSATSTFYLDPVFAGNSNSGSVALIDSTSTNGTIRWTFSSGLTTGYSLKLRGNATTSAYIQYSSEL